MEPAVASTQRTQPPAKNRETMKRWSQTVAVAALGSAFAIMVVRDVVHDSIPFFATKPSRLLYVLALGVVGGLVARLGHRLPVRLKLMVSLFSWSSCAVGLTAFLVYCGIRIAQVSKDIDISDALPWLLVTLGFLSVLCGWLWHSFWQAAKHRS